jgi:4-alpha-glucanotransferase
MLHARKGASEVSEKHIMQCNNKSEWTTEVEIKSPVDGISYQYVIQNPDQSFDYEYGGIRKIQIPTSNKSAFIFDNWRGPYGDSPFKTTAFTDCFFKRSNIYEQKKDKNTNLILRLNCPQMEPNRHFAVVGNQEALGNWDVAKKVRLDDSHFPVWSVSFDASNFTFPLEYKYLIVDTETDEVLAWGGGPNRTLKNADTQALTVVNDEHFLRTIPHGKEQELLFPYFHSAVKKALELVNSTI